MPDEKRPMNCAEIRKAIAENALTKERAVECIGRLQCSLGRAEAEASRDMDSAAEIRQTIRLIGETMKLPVSLPPPPESGIADVPDVIPVDAYKDLRDACKALKAENESLKVQLARVQGEVEEAERAKGASAGQVVKEHWKTREARERREAAKELQQTA